MIFYKPVKPEPEMIWNVENPLNPKSKVKVKPKPEEFWTRPITIAKQNAIFLKYISL